MIGLFEKLRAASMTAPKSLTRLSIALCLVVVFVEGNPMKDANGAPESRLKPCPRSPNCVSSLAGDDRHAIEPLVYTGTLETAYAALLGILEAQPRAKITARETDYIHAEFKSTVFGFVDDVEFFFPAGQPVIHLRSASRSGYRDFGVNRKRIERLRSLLEAALHIPGEEE